MKFSWASAGGWAARWAAGAVLGQIVFGPTTMLFIALLTGIALGAGVMCLTYRRKPVLARSARRLVGARLGARASRSWHAIRRSWVARRRTRRSAPSSRRVYSPLVPR